MNAQKVGLASFFALCVVGCRSPVPVAENFPVSYQKVARTAHHWDVIAGDVVNQTAATLAATQRLQGRPILVVPTTRNTAFDAVFNDFLITQMVDRGMQVSVCEPTGTGMIVDPEVKVKYHARVIIHSEAPQYRPGALTALAASVFVARSIGISDDTSTDAMWLAGVAAAGLADAAKGYVAMPTKTEVVVTTTIEENNRFVLRRSDIYYVPDGDANLFLRRVAQNSFCPSLRSENAVASAEDKAEVDRIARYELFKRKMRHTDPKWQPVEPSDLSLFD